jgi:hypothetical protein
MLIYHTKTSLFHRILPCLAGAHDIFQHPAENVALYDRFRFIKVKNFNRYSAHGKVDTELSEDPVKSLV